MPKIALKYILGYLVCVLSMYQSVLVPVCLSVAKKTLTLS